MARRRLAALIVALAASAPRGASADEDPTPGKAPSDPAPEAGGEEVSVVGTRTRETGGSVQVLKEAHLRRFGYTDPHQVLLQVPGVYVRPEDGVGLRPNIGIRGASSDRSKKVTLMEDGVLFGPAPYSAPAAYYFPLIERMQTVRVVKGPAAIVYGPHTVGGAVDLVTREIPSGPRLLADVGVGSYGWNKQRFSFGTSDERFGFLVEGVRLATSGFKELDGRRDADTGFVRDEWMVKGSWNVDPTAKVQNEIGLKLGYSDEDSNETYLGLTDADFRRTPYRRYAASARDRMRWKRSAVQVSHKVTFSSDVDLTTTLYRHDLHRTWDRFKGIDGADVAAVLAQPEGAQNAIAYGALTGAGGASPDVLFGPNDRTFVSQGAQTVVRWRPRTGPVAHRVEYGIRLHQDSIERWHAADVYATTANDLVRRGAPTRIEADNRASTHAMALHVADAMTWGRLVVTPGLRVEAIHASYADRRTGERAAGTYQVIVPGASGYFGLTRELGVLGGVHRGFSPAPPEQVRSAKPEESVNYETGLRYTGRRVRAEVIGFLNDYRRLTSICTFSSGCSESDLDRQFEGGSAQVYGLEAFAEWEPKLSSTLSLPLRSSYTLTKTEFLESFASGDPQFGAVRGGDAFPYVPTHQAQGSVALVHPRFGLHAGATFVDRMREVAGQGEPPPEARTDAYFLLDVGGSVRLAKSVELYLDVRNLLDDAYLAARRPFGARPGAPRWVQAGLRIDLDPR